MSEQNEDESSLDLSEEDDLDLSEEDDQDRDGGEGEEE